MTPFGFFFSPFLVWAHLREFIQRFLGPTFFGDNFFLWAHLRDLFGRGHTSRISLVFFFF